MINKVITGRKLVYTGTPAVTYRCVNCDHTFDCKKEICRVKCPKCTSRNIRIHNLNGNKIL